VLRWVVALALVGACGVDERLHQAERDREAAEQAEREKVRTLREARDAIDRIDKLEHDMADLDRKLTAAIDQVTAAQNDADRAAAMAKLKMLQKEQHDLQMRMAEAKAQAERAQRTQGMPVSQACKDNPLAKGCN
jgi:chromosome segregation ATPase